MFPKKREVVKRPEAIKILQPLTNVSPFVTHLGQDILRQGSQVFMAHGFGALVSLHHTLSDVYSVLLQFLCQAFKHRNFLRKRPLTGLPPRVQIIDGRLWHYPEKL